MLSPMHRGDAGVGALNTLLQERLNPPREGVPEARGGGRVYRPGDRVLQLKNDYTLEVFNGDLGTVRAIDQTEQEVGVELDDGREVRYPFTSLYSLTHAYAISIHKSQGAEFPAVVIPLVTAHAALLGRTLLYTAFTRARQLVVHRRAAEGAVDGGAGLAAGAALHGARRAARRDAAVRLGARRGGERGGGRGLVGGADGGGDGGVVLTEVARCVRWTGGERDGKCQARSPCGSPAASERGIRESCRRRIITKSTATDRYGIGKKGDVCLIRADPFRVVPRDTSEP